MNKNQTTKSLSKIIKFFGGRLFFGMTFLVGASLFFAWIASEVFEGETMLFDETLRNSIHQLSNPLLTKIMIFISFTGSVIFLLPLGILIIIILIFLKLKRPAVLFTMAMVGEIILEFLLKGFYHRMRPEAFFDYPLPLSSSFPSGHAFGSFCFYGMVAWLLTSLLQKYFPKLIVWLLTVAVILLIGFSRVYLGVHYPSDVLAGYLAAFIWCMTVISVDFYFYARSSENYQTN